MPHNVKQYGQVFTQEHTVKVMLSLIKNTGKILEPACGAGAFSQHLKCTALELDAEIAPPKARKIDFFDFPTRNKYETIIGNPPYVRYQDILTSTKQKLQSYQIFDNRSNLYLFFIYKSLKHLKSNGELIFITPQDFLKNTSAIKLNNLLYDSGTITDAIFLGDEKIFGKFQPNCFIWRFQKNNFSRKTTWSTAKLINEQLILSGTTIKNFGNFGGQLVFTVGEYSVPFKDLFEVKVGAVSGADEIFKHSGGNRDFITSSTFKTGQTTKFFYNTAAPELEVHKQRLLNRKIKKFTERNWYYWGRGCYESDQKRIYVNCKTRQTKPFFVHSGKYWDGSVLAIFLKDQQVEVGDVVESLNGVDWNDLGFVCDGRFIFSQRGLESVLLPGGFGRYKISTGKQNEK